jgi:hypothetical protein
MLDRAELVHASMTPVEEGPVPAAVASSAPIARNTGQLRHLHRMAGADPDADPTVRELVDRGAPPMAGGATGLGAAAYMHNLPAEGEYLMDTGAFFENTERNDIPLEVKAYGGLGGNPIDQRVSNIGLLTKVRLVFTGSLVVAGGGTVTANYPWPWNIFKQVTLNVNGQTGIITCEGLDLRGRRNRLYRNPRDQVSTAPAVSADQVVDPNPGVIANGTYSIVLVYDLPVSHDDYNMAGAIFAQSDQIYLSYRLQPAASGELFTLAGGSTATLTGSIFPTLTVFDIPYGDGPHGRQVLIPTDLQWLHGFLGGNLPFSNTGEVKVPFIRVGGQLVTYQFYIDNGGAAAIDPAALDALRMEYGGNIRPRNYQPVTHLLEKNVQDYNGRILPKTGYTVFDFEVDNAARDLVYPKGVTELAIVPTVNAGTTVNPNAHVHYVEESLFTGA